MKVIDLLNKIANGEELPKKIQVYNSKYRLLDNRTYHSIDHEGRLGQNYALDGMLNDDVKIIEDTPKEDIPTSKLYINNKLQYDLTPKEDKKIEKVNRGCIAGETLRNIDWHILDKLDEIIDRLNGEDNE